MRVLIDYHHAALAESLHLLFADRFGWEVYIPVGQAWWDEGYWEFGKSHWGDDRLARQFLNLGERDDAYPHRQHRLLTLERAKDYAFDYVLSTLPDNYPGYSRLAQEKGAKFIIQVGNVAQPWGWQYDPYAVLNSSSAPVAHPRTIAYHQEFSLRAFHYGAPKRTNLIASFVNCMDRMPCYPTMEALRAELPEYGWQVYGIDGPNGNIKPEARIAGAMRAAGWAFHDKVTGDGFGHIIHNWAAVGRPLIGHASHYAGQMAEPLWVDGETSIDLDRRTPREAADEIRAISADPTRHLQMCRAIRAKFDQLVDFAGEAERIRALLS